MPRSGSLPDLDRLLAPIQAGDRGAFAEWVTLATPCLVRRLYPYAPAIDPQEILQETLLRLWQQAPRFVPDGQPNAFLRFAVRCARNLACDGLRRSRRAPQPVGDLTLSPAAERQLATEPLEPDPALRRLLKAGLARLPAGPRAALEARLGGRAALPDSVLAARLGMRPNTFVQNIVRARRRLASYLAAAGVDAAAALGTACP